MINVNIAENSSDIQGLTSSEFKFALELLKLLSPLELATVQLSGKQLNKR